MGLAGADGFFYFLGQPAGPDGFSLFVEASQAARTDFFICRAGQTARTDFFLIWVGWAVDLLFLGRHGFIFSGAGRCPG